MAITTSDGPSIGPDERVSQDLGSRRLLWIACINSNTAEYDLDYNSHPILKSDM